MEYRRGAEIRAELKQLKTIFCNNLSRLESEILQCYENTPQDDLFNINQLYMAIREVEAVKTILYNLNEVQEQKAVAEKIILSLFTERESEIFKLIIKNYTAQEVADKLNISRRTVENYLRNMLIKICDDPMFSDAIQQSEMIKEFENLNYKNDKTDIDGKHPARTKFKNPQKILKFLYDIVSGQN